MNRIFAAQLEQHMHKKIRLNGVYSTLRPLGNLAFLLVKDGSGVAQVVISDKRLAKEMEQIQPGSVLQIEGTVSKGQKIELIDPIIKVLVETKQIPPLEYNKPEIQADLEHILDHRTVTLRNAKIQAVFKIQAELVHAYRLFMHDTMLATEYFGPNIIGTSSEGGAEYFTVDYFGYTATLAQSSQLYKQIMVGVNERVYALMPFFRAEPSHTTRHLTEGKQFEYEMALYDHWHELLDVQEACIKFMIQQVEQTCASSLALLDSWVTCPQDVPFPRLTFSEAQTIYYERTGIDDRQEPDLSPAAERELCRYAQETYGTEFVFILDWKREKRPFYSYPKPEDPTLTNTFDLLCRGAEITSGGQRCHTYEQVLAGIQEKEMDPNQFEDYLEVFRFGMPPHGGFGMGLERLTQSLLGLKNIREASLFPSDPKRIASQKLKAHIFYGEENVRNEIIRLLKDRDIPFAHAVHEPTPTSEDSAAVRGTSMEEGVKAIILRGKKSKKNYQFNLSSHLKLDMKAVSQIVGEKCDFESPEVIKERFGVVIGGVPPFGSLFNLDTFFDAQILQNEKCAFNCGLQTESVTMPSKQLIDVVGGKVVDFSKI